MKALYKHIADNPLVYINLDVERAAQLDLDAPGYYIIANNTEYARQLAEGRTNMVLVDEGRVLSSRELVEHPRTEAFLATVQSQYKKKPTIVVFKNIPQIEAYCTQKGWHLLNVAAALIARVEEKISQIEWLGELSHFLPPHSVSTVGDIVWPGKPFILQFNASHTGNDTFLIESETGLTELSAKFPKRVARTLSYIIGSTITSNNIVTPHGTLVGSVSYQITGLAPFTDRPFATVGNDWKLAHELLSAQNAERFTTMVKEIGDKLHADGYLGAFGIDVVLDSQSQKLYLIEINARQPASVPTESFLQSKQDPAGTTIFEAHLAALCGLPIDVPVTHIEDGAQIISRVTETVNSVTPQAMAALARIDGLTLIPSPGTTPGGEILRIRSEHGLMKAHGELNELGARIQGVLGGISKTY